jgi:hypothetical protein
VTPRYALLVPALFAYACGPRPPAKETHVRKPGNTAQALAAKLDVAVANGVHLAFHVSNEASKAVELNFPSGHTHDFVVTDTTGREVWKWSEGRLFTQAMQNKVLGREESVAYRADWNPGALHGTYIAVVSLRSENHPMEQRVRFDIP